MKIILTSLFLLGTYLITSAQTLTDIDGNTYNVVSIGSQVWMKENLRTTSYNDGEEIECITDDTKWSSLITPAYCWYDNDSINNASPHGALYNRYVLENENICPAGWHIPNLKDFNELISNLGGENIAGGKLKITGTEYWEVPNTGADNSSTLSIYPSGQRESNGNFDYMGKFSHHWVIIDDNYDRYFSCLYNSAITGLHDYYSKNSNIGASIRCIKDNEVSTIEFVSEKKFKVYPIPASDYIFIQGLKERHIAELYDNLGRLVHREESNLNKIDVSKLDSGVYVLVIKTNNQNINKLLIIKE